MFTMRFLEVLNSRILICLIALFFLLQSVCFAETNTESAKLKPDNYLIGMAVTKTFTGDYAIKLRFKNNTHNKYKLKELGNNSYSLYLPQVRSVIDEHDIYFENEHDDLKIVFSEKQDLVKPGFFYTQINFRTKDTSFLRIQAYAESSKVSESEKIKVTEEEKPITEKHLPNALWYFLIAFIFGFFAIFIMKKQSAEHQTSTKKSNNKIKSANSKKSQNPETKRKHKNKDLNLMPGVPELPFLEKPAKEKEEETTTDTDEEKIDLFDPENIKESEKKTVVFPDRNSIAERFKKRNLEKDMEDLIFLERDSFLEKMSPISDITEDVIKKDSDTNTDEEDSIQTQYDKLMNAFKNVLRIAHKISDDSLVPEVTDAFAISDDVGFCLVEYGEKTSLVGNIKDKVFLIRTFSPEELNNDTLFMEFCTESGNSQTYSVILNNFKALIRVTDTNISLIEDYTG